MRGHGDRWCKNHSGTDRQLAFPGLSPGFCYNSIIHTGVCDRFFGLVPIELKIWLSEPISLISKILKRIECLKSPLKASPGLLKEQFLGHFL